jgi:hypothetical protein
MLYPTAEVCPAQADIDRDLLRMAEGIVDQRWLLWLEGRPDGQQLAAEIRRKLTNSWSRARSLADSDIEAVRQSIVQLARKASERAGTDRSMVRDPSQ